MSGGDLAPFTCPECGRTVMVAAGGLSSRQRCPECAAQREHALHIARNKRQREGQKMPDFVPFVCPDCGRTMMINKYSLNRKRCPDCAGKARNKQTVEKARKLRETMVDYQCPICGKTVTVNAYGLRKRRACPECSKGVAREQSREWHADTYQARKGAESRPAPGYSIDEVLAYAKAHGLRGYDEARRALESETKGTPQI